MPHHVAARRGSLEILQWFLANVPCIHVDEESVDTSGRFSALHHAALGGHPHVVEWLVETAGADPGKKCVTVQGLLGLDASELATAHGYMDVVTYLCKHQEALTAAARVEKGWRGLGGFMQSARRQTIGDAAMQKRRHNSQGRGAMTQKDIMRCAPSQSRIDDRRRSGSICSSRPLPPCCAPSRFNFCRIPCS